MSGCKTRHSTLLIVLGCFILLKANAHGQESDPRWVQRYDTLLESDWQMVVDAPIDSALADEIGTQGVLGYRPDYFSYAVSGELRKFQVATWSRGMRRPFDAYSLMVLLQDGNPILFKETYTNGSRMGSCGLIEIENSCYARRGEWLYCRSEESPFFCYHNPIDTARLVEYADAFAQNAERWAFQAYRDLANEHREAWVSENIPLSDSASFEQEVNQAILATPVLISSELKDFELVWIKHYMDQAKCVLGESYKYAPQSVIPTVSFLGENYIELRVGSGEPTAIDRYTTYYFRRKEV